MADHGFSERRACRLIGVNRSAWQYEPLCGKDDAVRERMREIANERRRFGYRRLAILLRREGKGMNLKKVYRLYLEERLTVRKRGGRKRALGTQAPMALLQEPNQRWSLDNALGHVGLRPAVPHAQRDRRLQPGMSCLYRRYLAVRSAGRSRVECHRRTSRAAVHSGQRQRPMSGSSGGIRPADLYAPTGIGAACILSQMASTVNGIALCHSKHRIHRCRSDRGPHHP
ncbi:MAG: transposase [Sphingomonadaceae bacterium]|nr:transposase [Sphingomonadaceae bacterium]